jgi:hypothetical protein
VRGKAGQMRYAYMAGHLHDAGPDIWERKGRAHAVDNSGQMREARQGRCARSGRTDGRGYAGMMR